MNGRAAPSVLVYGAGAIGLWIGGSLAAAGVPVQFIARPRIVEALQCSGLRLTGLDGVERRVLPEQLSASSQLAAGLQPSLVLLTTKGGATKEAAAELQAQLPAGTAVVSFQNGVDNPARLRAAAPALQSIAGMVPFNVVQTEPGVLRQTTSGQLAAQRHPALQIWLSAFAAAGLPLQLHTDMRAVQWGKLLLNLNNPINALAGIPLREQLLDRGYRRVLADLQEEALRALAAAGIRPARVTPLPSSWLPRLLRLPTWLFARLANRMLNIAPDARSSMYDDRVAGRPTEVDDLCGAVLRLAQAHGGDAPRNRRMIELISQIQPGQFLRSDQLMARLKS